ncbi:MAG: SDR family oxidoreductase [Polyangiales bacterium]
MDELFGRKWVLITGASSGFGVDFARQLAARGANLILTARSEAKLRSLGEELSSRHGIEHRVVTQDLSAPGGALALGDAVLGLGLEVEHVINNAGFGLGGAFWDSPAERSAEMVRVNCEAVTALTGKLLPPMIARNRGGFLQVASVAGFQPTPFLSVYGATKAFVVSFTSGLAEELRDRDVRMCALCPGPVQTGFQAAAGVEIAAAQRASVLTSEDTVRRGLVAYEKRTVIYVPGVVNKLGGVVSKLLPRAVVAHAAAGIMKDRGRG